jgi:glutamine amidotransferase
MDRIAIIDYGLGNLRSVQGAVEKVGFEPIITHQADELRAARKLILPGVGAFGDGMQNLRDRRLVELLTELVMRDGKPILGICLGAQLIAKQSEEFGVHLGLGWVDARVTRLVPADRELRVPHVGWNEVQRKKPCVLFDGIPQSALFYFVHSFYIATGDPELVAGESDYGMRFASVIQAKNIYATQFHPEKSQLHGLAMLKNFLEKAE